MPLKAPALVILAVMCGCVGVYALWPNVADEAGNRPWEEATTGVAFATEGLRLDPVVTGAITAPAPTQAEIAPLIVAQAPPAQVDESALRYFARIGDAARLEAEIARLQALYPNWVPPLDPLATPAFTDPELDRMWELFSEGRYAELAAAIATRRQDEPGWVPPTALVELLEIAQSREQLIAASNARQFATVIRIAASTPELLVCAEVDVMWRLAEAFAATARPDRALDAYSYLLANCDNADERLATMQKALEQLGLDGISALWFFERVGDDGEGEFAELRVDVSRRAAAIAAGDVGFFLAAEDRERIEEAALTGTGVEDATLLGWYHQLRGNAREGERWFRLAWEREPNAEIAEGLALSLIALNRPGEAEEIAYDWRNDSDDIMGVYLSAVAGLLAQRPVPDIASSVLSRIVATVGAERDAVSARQLGWYAYQLQQVTTAEQWFEAALGWDPDDEEAAYGIALSRQLLGDTAGLAEIIRLWGARSDRIRAITGGQTGAAPMDLTVPTAPAAAPAQTVAVTTPATTNTTTTTGCSSSADPSRLSPGAALSRGWCLMDLNRPIEAAAAFEVAMGSTSTSTRTDAAYGLTLAYLAAGLTDRAAVAATQTQQTQARQTEMEAAIYAQRAVAAFGDGRYTEALDWLNQRSRLGVGEQNDLMMVRGYSHLYLRQLTQARQVFAAVAATGYTPAVDGLVEAERRLNPLVE